MKNDWRYRGEPIFFVFPLLSHVPSYFCHRAKTFRYLRIGFPTCQNRVREPRELFSSALAGLLRKSMNMEA
jgi:hypothetical protein